MDGLIDLLLWIVQGVSFLFSGESWLLAVRTLRCNNFAYSSYPDLRLNHLPLN